MLWCIVAVFVVLVKTAVAVCPEKCTCVGVITNCADTNQTIIPHKVPSETERLLLSRNQLTELSFSSDVSIRYYLKVVAYTSHNTFRNVKYLDLSSNQITTLDTAEIFIFTRALEELKLDGNKISAFLENGNGAFQSVPNLKILSMKDNKLQHGLESGDFLGLNNLTKLDLTNNQIPRVESNAFQHSSKLEEVKLGRNRIEFLGPGCFETLSALKVLDLSHNLLHKANLLFSSNNLVSSLYLNNNLLQTFPKLIAANLKTLDLSRNSILVVDKNVIVEMKTLGFLNLTFNRMTQPLSVDVGGRLIVDASWNNWNCSCSAWVGRRVNNRSVECNEEDGIVMSEMREGSTSICAVCTRGHAMSMTQLNGVCDDSEDDEKGMKIVVLAAALGGAAGLILITCAAYKAKKVGMFDLNKERRKNEPEPSNPRSFRDRRRRTFRQLRQIVQERVGSRRGSDIECISHHPYCSISLPGYVRPDPIYCEIVDPYAAAGDVQNYVNTGPRESQSTTTSTMSSESPGSPNRKQSDPVEEYCFPDGQTKPGSIDFAKPIPRSGFVPSTPMVKHLKHAHKREPSNPYLVPIKPSTNHDYIDLNR